MKTLELNQMEEFHGGDFSAGECAFLSVALVGLGAAGTIATGGAAAPMVAFGILSLAAACG